MSGAFGGRLLVGGRRLWLMTMKELRQLVRDPILLAFIRENPEAIAYFGEQQ